MNAAEVLELAADLIVARGWCSKASTDSEGRVCALQAIHLAQGGTECEVDGDYIAPRRDVLEAMLRYLPAQDRFFSPASRIWFWNDDNNNGPNVIATLRAVATILRAQAAATPAPKQKENTCLTM